jgi:hypothetical protein
MGYFLAFCSHLRGADEKLKENCVRDVFKSLWPTKKSELKNTKKLKITRFLESAQLGSFGTKI